MPGHPSSLLFLALFFLSHLWYKEALDVLQWCDVTHHIISAKLNDGTSLELLFLFTCETGYNSSYVDKYMYAMSTLRQTAFDMLENVY